jgi:spoIIIJ-associated protein
MRWRQGSKGRPSTLEWVETTGKTILEAKQEALQKLGVAEQEAEFEVVNDAKSGLFGRVKVEARVRARVRPAVVPEKRSQRRRGDRRSDSRSRPSSKTTGSHGEGNGQKRSSSKQRGEGARDANKIALDQSSVSIQSEGHGRKSKSAGSSRDRRVKNESVEARRLATGSVGEGDFNNEGKVEEEVTEEQLAEMQEEAREFVEGLVKSFGLTAAVTASNDGSWLKVTVDGDGLGALIGPKGVTLRAISEVTRTVLQRQGVGKVPPVKVDVGGYWERRAQALEEFAKKIGQRVLETGKPQALEAMNSADRRIVHNALADFHGVGTRSEGQEPRRYVVVFPES